MRIFKLCVIFVIILSCFCFECLGGNLNVPLKPVSMKSGPQYKIIGDYGEKKLIAEVDGLEYEIELKGGPCFGISHEGDFNFDNRNEVLLYSSECGNCCPPGYFFVLYKGNGNFFVTKKFTYPWNNPKIELWNGKYSILAKENNEGFNVDKRVQVTKRFVLEYDVIKVEEYEKKYVKTVAEITSEEVDRKSYEENGIDKIGFLYYDLNNDGCDEYIKCKLWERWGVLHGCGLYTGNGRKISDFKGEGKCIGILKSKTNGMNNIVCDFDQIWVWTGNKYVKK